MNFKKLLSEIIDFIYVRKCSSCNCSIDEGVLCKNCLKTVENIPPFTQGKVNGYDLFCALYYKDAVKEMIHDLKFKHNKECAKYCAEFLFDFIEEIKNNYSYNFKNALIIPVPTHKFNKAERGYDNVYEICRELAFLGNFSINNKVLKKIKYTTPQYELTKKERKNNPKNSFSLDKDFKTEDLIILIDDIFTTGATLEYITSLFKKNNISNLICVTLAKTPYRKKI